MISRSLKIPRSRGHVVTTAMAQYAACGAGEAPATVRQLKYAVRYMDMFLATKDMDSFAELLARNDGALNDEALWRQLATWMASHAKLITDQTKGLDAGTALKMLSSLTKAAKNAAPEHPLWASSAVNRWYQDVRTHVEKTIHRREILEGDEDDQELQDIGHELLTEMVNALNKTGTPDDLTRALALVLTFHCVGRPGEFVFVSLEKLFYDSERETATVIWSEMKKMSQYKVPLSVGNKKELCPFWSMSGFYLSGAASGVARGANTSGAHFMFSKLAQVPDSAQQFLNIAVKDCIAVAVSASQAPYFSGKSLRRGGVGHLTGALALRHDLLPAVAMGNWAIPCRITEYFGEKARESKRAVATRSLAGWTNPYTKVVPPHLVPSAQFPAEQVANLVVHAYGEHYIDLSPGRRLAKVGELLLAVELMHLPEIVADRQGATRAIVQSTVNAMPLRIIALLDKAHTAGLGDGMVGRAHLLDLLVSQGKLILRQFRRDNAAQALAGAADGLAADAVTALVTQYADLQAQNMELRKVRAFLATHYFIRWFTLHHFRAQHVQTQAAWMHHMASSVQQMSSDITALSRGAASGQAGPSPLGKTRRASASAAGTAGAGGAARVSPLAGFELVASNADGGDDRGYVVPPRFPLVTFVTDVVTQGLGQITGRQIHWVESKWRPLSEARGQKPDIDRNFEARKIMELFLYLVTDVQLQDITAPLPPHDRAAVVERRMTAVSAVVAYMKDVYLDEHERYLPTAGRAGDSNRGGQKSNNCGALYSRWKRVKYEKGRPQGAPVPPAGRVENWANAGIMLGQPAIKPKVSRTTTDEQVQSSKGKKRQRK